MQYSLERPGANGHIARRAGGNTVRIVTSLASSPQIKLSRPVQLDRRNELNLRTDLNRRNELWTSYIYIYIYIHIYIHIYIYIYIYGSMKVLQQRRRTMTRQARVAASRLDSMGVM